MVKLKKKPVKTDMECLPDVLRIADILVGKKANNIRGYDLRGLTLIADCFVVCDASSQPQFKALLTSVREGMKEVGVAPLRVEGPVSGDWMIIDYGVILVHIFREKAREYFDLDGFWGDAKTIELGLDEDDQKS